jgi:biotin operon repressor
MGFADWIVRKLTKRKPRAGGAESSQLKKALESRYTEEEGRSTVTLTKMDTPSHQMFTPAVEHPLLTIQDRISKLEETYRSLSERLMSVDVKVATKHDIEDVKHLLNTGLKNDDRVLGGIDDLSASIDKLKQEREHLTKSIETSSKQLAQVDQTLQQLECDEKITNALASGDMSTIELAEKLGFTRQYVWERMKSLTTAGKVSSVKRGRQTKYALVN